MQLPVAVLIATRNRPALLRERALPSVASQSLVPDLVVIINDGDEWTTREIESFAALFSHTQFLCLPNRRSTGAGGAWNTGLEVIHETFDDAFVAILDDDDLWDPQHLEINSKAAIDHGANIVVSGLRMMTAAGEIHRPLIAALDDRAFLVGNRGWQGSNTFVSLALIMQVGGFRESLLSSHDRDLAIRLLRHPEARPWLVPYWSSTWCLDAPDRLSSRGSDAKLQGLRTFYRIYGAEMTSSEEEAFFDRAQSLFGFSRSQLVPTRPPHQPFAPVHRGDLHVYASEQL